MRNKVMLCEGYLSSWVSMHIWESSLCRHLCWKLHAQSLYCNIYTPSWWEILFGTTC